MRETGMTPYELLLSESQERMLAVVKAGQESVARRIFDKWDLDCAVIGTVTSTGHAVMKMHGKVYADMAVAPITNEAPKYDRPSAEPDYFARHRAFDLRSVPQPADLTATLKTLLASPNLAEKRWVWRQYDHHVRTNTLQGPGAEAAIVRIKGRKKAIALTTDCNSRWVYLNPRRGAMHAVAESARNISMTGAAPLAITDCLNFGSPENPAIMWQFKEAVGGLAEACVALSTPVVSGNVSFYNETDGSAVYPAPAVGMVGLIEEADKAIGNRLPGPGHTILLLGATMGEIGGSEYLSLIHGLETGEIPQLDFALEKKLQEFVRDLVAREYIAGAKDLSDGGLAVALAEMCFRPEDAVGCAVTIAGVGRPDFLLFGEDASRALIVCEAGNTKQITTAAMMAGVACAVIGHSGGDGFNIEVNGKIEISAKVEDLRQLWKCGFAKALGFE